MHIDWTINIGTLIQTGVVIVAVVGGFFALKNKLATLELILNTHAKDISDHSIKMNDYEKDLRDLVGTMQRIAAEFGMFLRLRNERRTDTAPS